MISLLQSWHDTGLQTKSGGQSLEDVQVPHSSQASFDPQTQSPSMVSEQKHVPPRTGSVPHSPVPSKQEAQGLVHVGVPCPNAGVRMDVRIGAVQATAAPAPIR